MTTITTINGDDQPITMMIDEGGGGKRKKREDEDSVNSIDFILPSQPSPKKKEEEEVEEEEQQHDKKKRKLNDNVFNDILNQEKCKNAILKFRNNFDFHFSPFLLIVCMILIIYASYILIVNSKIFTILYIIFIIAALFIPNMADSIMTHIPISMFTFHQMIGNVSIIKYDTEKNKFTLTSENKSKFF